MQFPLIETDRLVLKELDQNDSGNLFDILSDPDVTQFYNIPTFSHLIQAKKLVNRRRDRFYKGQGICWAIWLKSESRLVGTCGFNAWFKQRQVGDLGYELAHSFWSRGLMTEALKEVVTYGFETLDLLQQRAWVVPENRASARVLEKIGFESQGVQLARGYWNGTFHDLELFTKTAAQANPMAFPI